MTNTTLGATGGQAPYTDMDTPLSTNANQKADAFAGQETADPAAQAKQAARGVAGQVKERLVNTADGQKAGIADRLDEVADSLHRSSEQFAGKQDWIASAITRGASELGMLASSVRTTNVVDLLGQVQSFARRQPGLFIGASLVAGFALARFGKLVAADVSRDDLPVMPEVGHGQH